MCNERSRESGPEGVPRVGCHMIFIITLLLPLVLSINPCFFQHISNETGLERECVRRLSVMVDISQIILGLPEPAIT